MKLKDFMDMKTVIAKHTAKLTKLGDVEITSLSISELAFIKMVSSSSITRMKRFNVTNEQILCTEQRRSIQGNEMKVKFYLRNMPQDELIALLESLKR